METSGPAKKWVKMTTHPVQAGLRRNSIFFGQKCILSQKTAKNAFYPKKRPKFLKRLIFIAPKASGEGACLQTEMGTTAMECDWWLCVLICLPLGSWVGYCSAGTYMGHTYRCQIWVQEGHTFGGDCDDGVSACIWTNHSNFDYMRYWPTQS